ncbi:MAG TPA: pentapeptide repeat-containing protein, partial [Candidatus Limnocylindrales bacterium]|nr:pentapeptide repeat-containing protein [Candidatus Limnocylindrales bacterium]
NAGGAYFANADLSSAICTNADFESTTLDGANVAGTDFTNADFSLVHAIGIVGCPAALPSNWVCLSGMLVGPFAGLNYANLSGVDFSGLNLDSIVLVHANLTGTVFAGTNLSYARLDHANLTNADMSTATLTRVSASSLAGCPAALPPGWACIANTLVGPGATMEDADFTGVNFAGFDLTGATFRDCNISDATFAGANLTGVDWYYSICPDHEQSYNYISCCSHLIDVPASCGP